MGKFYNNRINVNNGVTLDGPEPMDDRLVVRGFESLYVNNRQGALYGRMYYGAQVTVLEPIPNDDAHFKAHLLILKDATPYEVRGELDPVSGDITVNASNYLNYWYSISSSIVDATYFSGGDYDKNYTTIAPHGMLPAGTSVAALETMTISEILCEILFETAYPVKTKNASASINFVSSSAYKTVVEVGSTWPTAADLTNTYQSEAWNWSSSQDPTVKGTEKNLSMKGAVTYFYNSTNSTTGGMLITDSQYTGKRAKEGTNGYLYATIAQLAGDYAVDSRGRNKNPETGQYYAAPKTNTLTTGTITFKAGWRVYTNATKVYSTASAAWNAKGANPGAYTGVGTQNPVDLILYQPRNTLQTYYFQWPGQTSSSQTFHIYVPVTYEIKTAGAANPNVKDTFDVSTTATAATATVNITNTLDATGEFYKYTISKQPGISTVEITFNKRA